MIISCHIVPRAPSSLCKKVAFWQLLAVKAIEKIWLPNKKSHWRTLHAALLAVICLLIQPNIDGFLKFFFFKSVGNFHQNFSDQIYFSHAMVTRIIATWSIAASILINLELNLWGSICPYDSFIISHLRLSTEVGMSNVRYLAKF